MKTGRREFDERGPGGGRENEEALVAEILAFLASAPERLVTLMTETGLEPDALRRAGSDATVRHGLLDHVMSDDGLLIALAAHAGRPPEALAAAITRARGRQPAWGG